MTQRGQSGSASEGRARARLAERLEERMPEIEQAAITRLRGIGKVTSAVDATYAESLRSAAQAALGYLLAGVKDGDARPPEPPAAVLIQARVAARAQIDLATVLRRCVAGYAIFGDFLALEAEEAKVRATTMRRLLSAQSALLDRLIAAVTEEHDREAASQLTSNEERRAELVKRLLAGEPLQASELEYDFDGNHLGLYGQGPQLLELVGELAGALDCRLLAIRRPDQLLWAWLGSRRSLSASSLQAQIAALAAPSCLALGESASGLGGWRTSHYQAAAAWPVARRSDGRIVSYGEVALLAAALKDELLLDTLRHVYLEPLEQVRHDGEALRETLRAYFRAEHNMSSAASALGVTRQTVTNRLRAIEEVVGRQLGECSAELELALDLERLSVTNTSQPDI